MKWKDWALLEYFRLDTALLDLGVSVPTIAAGEVTGCSTLSIHLLLEPGSRSCAHRGFLSRRSGDTGIAQWGCRQHQIRGSEEVDELTPIRVTFRRSELWFVTGGCVVVVLP